MPEYTVHIYSTVSTAVTVEADDPEQASEAVWDSADMPGSITHGAFGQGAAVDHDGEWLVSAVSDESGEEVWRETTTEDDLRAELEERRTEAQQLRKQVETLIEEKRQLVVAGRTGQLCW